MASIWGAEFEVESTQSKAQRIKSKMDNPKKVKKTKEVSIKSKKLTLDDKLEIIRENVEKYLSVYKESTIVLKSKAELEDYINRSIENGIIAIDTETNNSLDPLTCKIMGACIYTPGLKNAYIPINHVDKDTRVRFDWQVTEEELKEQFDRLKDTKILMHNGKFDFKVIKLTCDCDLDIYWDSMVAARILDENEHSAGLKQQYIDKIDPSIEKYSIDKLFNEIEYAVVDPELFALYAATDAYMTYRLYEYQYNEFTKPGNERLLKLLTDIEFPIIKISAGMEMRGIALDTEYCKRLSAKYHRELDIIEQEIADELNKIKPLIDDWRLTEKANLCYYQLKGDKTINFVRPEEEEGIRQKYGKQVLRKPMSMQLEDPPSTKSPTQLSILLYDILRVKSVDKSNPRGTGEEILKQIDLPICKLILKQRTTLKMLDAFIDSLPQKLSTRDNRIHSNFKQLGTDTGRFSCTEP